MSNTTEPHARAGANLSDPRADLSALAAALSTEQLADLLDTARHAVNPDVYGALNGASLGTTSALGLVVDLWTVVETLALGGLSEAALHAERDRARDLARAALATLRATEADLAEVRAHLHNLTRP